AIPGVDTEYVDPRSGWDSAAAYDEQARKLAALFEQNITKFDVSDDIIKAGPKSV
ncbi:MAG: phosphoenolpyruvate carboxykinase (ATP), partial [Halieaceae bacterium]|nr:phosphoenolpyruvate carboxykinase (ATP) [Halieaceae bacterium]